MLSRCNVVNFYYHIMFPYTRQHVISTSHLKMLSLLFTPFSVTRFAMHRIYADRINSRGMSRVFCDLRSHKTPRGILPVNNNQNSPLYFRPKRKEPLCRALAEGWKKGGYIHLYKQMRCAIWSFNICNIRLGCSGYCYYAISHHPGLAIQYLGFTINAVQSIETNFFSSASFLVSSFGKVT